ncbi:MAG TPA: hypothetical protein PK002_00430 [Cellvibrio sp.]|nr:hypothetical protein [Cellvibrio sp.]
MCGWLLQIPILVQFKLGLVPMVFNTALCFTLSGIALLLDNQKTKIRHRAQTVIGAFLLVLCSLTFIEITTNENWGIDLHEQHLWIADGNVRPGRMAPNSALGFILTAIALILIPRVTTKYQALLVQIVTFSILAIGLTGLVGYVLSPDLLFGWARSARMAIPTAFGMILIASGLWLSWNRAQWYSSRHYLREDEKITFIGTAILIVVTITAGLAGFAAQQSLFEKSLQQRLQVSMSNRLSVFYSAINQANDDSENAAHHPDFIVATRNLITDNTTANMANQNLEQRFHAIAVKDTHNNSRWVSGTFKHDARFAIAIDATTTFYWKDGFYLKTESKIF